MNFTVPGHFTADGKIALDETAPFVPTGQVLVTVEPIERSNPRRSGLLTMDDEEWNRRKAMIQSGIGCLSDSEAKEIERVIEEAFERVDDESA